jgi:hypothetical protein
MKDLVITVTPERDWYTVQDKGELIVCGHRPTIQDLEIILEHFTGRPVEVVEVVETVVDKLLKL